MCFDSVFVCQLCVMCWCDVKENFVLFLPMKGISINYSNIHNYIIENICSFKGKSTIFNTSLTPSNDIRYHPCILELAPYIKLFGDIWNFYVCRKLFNYDDACRTPELCVVLTMLKKKMYEISWEVVMTEGWLPLFIVYTLRDTHRCNID